ncbi:MAG: CvpA family protein [Clostridia bacterium]|nr:CvpA family protein [Clostridia bacterium]
MALVLDIVAVGLFIFFVWRGVRRGFIKTIAGILSLIIAFWGAGLLVDAAAPSISDKYVTPWVSDFISPKVDEAQPETPTEFENMLVDIGVPEGMAGDIVTSKPVTDLVESVSHSLAETLTRGVLYIVFFIILYLLLKLVVLIIDKIFDLPVLNFANGLLGLVCGAIFGFLIVYLVGTLLKNVGLFIDEQTLADTYILKNILALKPF